jgi:nucleotide-binding universal stress UspA family protein
VQAVSDILNGLRFGPDEAVLFSKTIRDREKHNQQCQEHIHLGLENSGYTITGDQKCHMMDDCAHQIIDYIKAKEQELLVICTSHEPTKQLIWSHFSVTLATDTPSSVLILRKSLLPARERLRILFGVDESDATMTAARKLSTLIRTDAADVHLVSVQSFAYQDSSALASYVNPEIIQEAMNANTEIVFDMVSEVLEAQGISVCSRRKLQGSAATELAQLAEHENPDLIVVGSHNKKGFVAWLLGSVSSKLLHWDNHNILIIR